MSDDEESPAQGTAAANKAGRFLAAASCILATRGELDAVVPPADDEGIDLLFHRRGGRAALAVQVKVRRSTAKGVQSQRFRAWVRLQTFEPRADLDILFMAIDVERVAIMMAWLVPSPAFAAMAAGPDAKGRLRFTASMKPDADDQWLPFRLTAEQLPPLVLCRLHQLDGG